MLQAIHLKNFPIKMEKLVEVSIKGIAYNDLLKNTKKASLVSDTTIINQISGRNLSALVSKIKRQDRGTTKRWYIFHI